MRIVICVLLLMYNLGNLKAQNFEVGGNVSLNTSWILNQNAYEIMELVCPNDPLIAGSEPGYALTMGYSIGALAGYDSDRFWGVAAEVNYTKRGQNYKDSWIGNDCIDHGLNREVRDFKRNFSLHYLEVPLLFKIKAQNRKKVKAYGEVGVQVGVLIAGKDKVTIPALTAELPFASVNSKVRRLDAGLILGGGVNIKLNGNLYISTGARTYFSFIDLNKGDAAAFVSDNQNSYSQSRNFSFGANVGIHYVFDWVGGIYR